MNLIESCVEKFVDLGVKFYIFYVDNSHSSLAIKSTIHGVVLGYIFPWEELATKLIIIICTGTVSYITQIILATLIPYQKIRNYLDKKMSRNQSNKPNLNKNESSIKRKKGS